MPGLGSQGQTKPGNAAEVSTGQRDSRTAGQLPWNSGDEGAQQGTGDTVQVTQRTAPQGGLCHQRAEGTHGLQDSS